jgi:hypothetical protein
MKTSLAIVLATAALMFTATIGIAHPSKGFPGPFGAVAYPTNIDQAPRPSGPGPYRGQM